MFLKSIEVQGFKSFANKLTFEFRQGITGIVGPNGSGKSNVADAVRWVLGEQSAKQLRGSKMEDVIFSGTENRKPLGFAYVAITLDNSDHQLAIDYDTVTVSRRVYRSGESEYKINDHNCRLKDIQELFFDTGIGKEGYSIIGQGQIDKILSGKPEDRRELFDEAVGIVKYKKRKALTEKNLDIEQQNLNRLKDILYELEHQLGPLKEEDEKARAYLELREQLKIYDANSYLSVFKKIKEDLAVTEERLAIVTAQTEEARQKETQIKESYAEVEALIEEIDQKISGLTEASGRVAVESQRIDGDAALLKTRLESLRSSHAGLTDRLDRLAQSDREKASDIMALEDELKGLISERDALSGSSDEAQKEVAEHLKKMQALRERSDSLNADLIRLLNQTAETQGRAERYDTMAEQAALRLDELSQRRQSLSTGTQKEDTLVEGLSQESEEIDKSKRELAAKISDGNEENRKITDELQKKREALAVQTRNYHESGSRYQTLKNIAERYDGFSGSIRRVMEQRDKYPGVIGVVADVIRVPREYEIAIETALGGTISNVVTDNERTAKAMIAFLKENRYGRATFLPMTSIWGRTSDQASEVVKEPGVIGLASDLVSSEPRFGDICRFLLGRIFVVDHIDNALALARKYRHTLRIVTLEGELLSPGGSISGGAYKHSGNLLGRQHDMEEMRTRTLKYKENMDRIQGEIDKLQQRKDKLKAQAETFRKNLTDLELRENTVRLRMKQVRDSKETHRRSLEDMDTEILELRTQISEIDQLKKETAEEIGTLSEKRKETEKALETVSASLSEMTESEHDLNGRTADLRVAFSNILQQISFNQEKTEALKAERISLKDQAERTRQEMADSAEEEAKVLKALDDNAQEGEAARLKAEELKAELAAVNEERNRHASEHKTFFDRREEITRLLSDLDKEEYRLKAQRDKISENRASLSTYMWEEYHLTYQSAKEWENEEILALSAGQMKKKINELKSQIRSLGNVNVNAIEQYKEISSRYETMKTQYDDVVAAEEKLTGIIDSLNRSMRKQFAEKFGQIRDEFDRIFKKLFGGGAGTLTLSDPDDLLETGIIITAQPPGKKLQNMMQLSGGEKALTAIALLFAIQSLKPSPFCLLDEIEAALDDANVVRYAEYLHNLTKDTQFIVITHRRGTMKAADVLYGITMQEKGVSTLVSVNLIEDKLSK